MIFRYNMLIWGLSIIPAAVGDVLYFFGVPLAAIYWYRQDKTLGRLLFLTGLGIPAVLKIVFMLVFLPVGFFGDLDTVLERMSYSSDFLQSFGFLGELIAMAGFAIVVLRETDLVKARGDA